MLTVDSAKRSALAMELKALIIERLELEDITPESVADDSPIFGEGLGLDSLDALDLVLLLENRYGIKITDPAQAKEILATINSLAEFIIKNGGS